MLEQLSELHAAAQRMNYCVKRIDMRRDDELVSLHLKGLGDGLNRFVAVPDDVTEAISRLGRGVVVFQGHFAPTFHEFVAITAYEYLSMYHQGHSETLEMMLKFEQNLGEKWLRFKGIFDLRQPLPTISSELKAGLIDEYRAAEARLRPNEFEAAKRELDDGGKQADDESAFVLASNLWPDRFSEYKPFRAWLNKTPDVRHKNPSKYRLLVHAGDWAKYWAREEVRKFESMDVADIEARKLEQRERRK